jgi:hypothetical protein
MLVGAVYKKNMKFDLNSTMLLKFQQNTDRLPKYYNKLFKPLGFLSASPFFSFVLFKFNQVHIPCISESR